ncbi:MAG TPA: FAD-binding protein, partial [Baekduia sp.]
HRLDGLEIDAGRRVARIGAGVTAGALARAAAEHGLAAPVGLAPSVGVAGLALGGGVGWLGRAHGLASSAIAALDVVTADGAARRVDAGSEPDLLFALRGGGGRYAIVTALELRLHPVDEVSAGMLAWPAEAAGEVLEQVRRAALDAPECLTLVVRVLSVPPLDAIPEPLRGRRIVAVVAAHLGPHQDARRLIAPLRSGATLVDTFGPIGVADLVTVAGDPEAPGPARGDGLLLEDLGPDAVAALTGVVEDEELADALTILEVRQLGGALGRPAAEPAALARVDAGWAVFAGGFAPDAAAAERVVSAIARVRERLAPHTARQVLLNSRAAGADPARAFDRDTWARLRRIHDAHDPDRLIVAAHGG